MRFAARLTILGMAISMSAQELSIPQPGGQELSRANYHRVTSKRSPAPEPGAEDTPLPSLLAGVRDARDWLNVRRPQLVKEWTRILGKITPGPQDLQWFGDATQAVEQSRREMDGYTRIDLDIPIEKDFLQRHLLLLPKGQGSGPFRWSLPGLPARPIIASRNNGGALTLQGTAMWC